MALIFTQNLWASAYGKVSSGNNMYKQSEYDKSLDKYREAQISAPDDPVIHFNMGDAYYKMGAYDDSNNEYSKVLNSKDKLLRSKAYYNLGNNAFSRQKYDEALNYYKKCLDLNPKDMDAKYNIEFLLNHKNQPKPGKGGSDDKNGKNKDKDRDKQNAAAGKESDKDKKDKKNTMSKEDAQRILQYYNDQERNSADKRKMKSPEMPKTDEDW